MMNKDSIGASGFYTPGPWTRTHPEFYPIGESRWQVRGQDGELIATIEKRPKGSKDRGDANGDLIAAAPELAECLRELAEFSVDESHYRNNERSKAARKAAYDLLNRLGL